MTRDLLTRFTGAPQEIAAAQDRYYRYVLERLMDGLEADLEAGAHDGDPQAADPAGTNSADSGPAGSDPADSAGPDDPAGPASTAGPDGPVDPVDSAGPAGPDGPVDPVGAADSDRSG